MSDFDDLERTTDRLLGKEESDEFLRSFKSEPERHLTHLFKAKDVDLKNRSKAFLVSNQKTPPPKGLWRRESQANIGTPCSV